METKIIKQEKNPFLGREEFLVEITADAAPSASEVIAEMEKDAELSFVKKINTNFGRRTFLTELVVYNNKEAKEKVEVIPQKARKKMEADRKAAEEEERKKKAEEEAKKAEEEERKKKAEEEAKKAEEDTLVNSENDKTGAVPNTEEEAPLGVPENSELEGKEEAKE